MTPDQARWCTERVHDGTLSIDGDELTVTEAGWDLIMAIGTAGTVLEGETLDRAFVLGAAHGAGEVSILFDTIVKLDGILVAVELGLDPAPAHVPPPPPEVIVIDHNADPADDTPLQAEIRALLENGEPDAG